jgi:bifunctional non-homologous end joining protein LigD
MLATLVDKPFNNKDWIFEIKYDGFRILGYITKGVVRLKSRKNADYTTRFRPIVDTLKRYKADMILDGEIVVINNAGVSDFEALINWKTDADGLLVYYVFDLLYFKGRDFMKLPVVKRKSTLEKLLRPSHEVRFVTHIPMHGEAAFRMATRNGLEGIIAKKADSLYKPGIRSKEWQKFKTYKERDAIIVGYTSQNGPAVINSLLLAAYEKNLLVYLGEVGTGWNARELMQILASIKVVKRCPLAKIPVLKGGRWGRKAPAFMAWCRPELVCSIKYLEITKAGELRHASFLRLHPDKAPAEVVH